MIESSSTTWGFRRTGSSIAVLLYLLLIVIAVMLFWWYAHTIIARPYETPYGANFLYGAAHGFFAIPSWLLSLFVPDVTIYQAPNCGFWYNAGFLFGILPAAAGARKIFV
jgi:hypothetical protein